MTAVRSEVNPGDTVTLAVEPDLGYTLTTISATYGGESLTPIQSPDNSRRYTFTMPNAAVTVTATFTPIEYTIDYQWTGVDSSSFTVEDEAIVLAQPTRQGYTLTGWAFTASGAVISPVTAETLLGHAVGETVKLYPIWTKERHIHALSAWQTNETDHWRVCEDSNCPVTDYKANVGQHVRDNGTVTVQPTYDSTGVKVYKCATCEYVMETVTLDQLVRGHEHDWATEWSTSATHHWHMCNAAGCDITDNAQKDGYAAHIYDDDLDTTCNACGYTRTVTQPEPVPVNPGDTIDIPGGGQVKGEENGNVTITDGKGGVITVTPPADGDGGSITVDPDTGNVNVPGGSTVTTGDNVKITIDEGTAGVAPNGVVTFPEGGKATVTDKNGKETSVSVPAGGAVDPADYKKPTTSRPSGSSGRPTLQPEQEIATAACPKDETCPVAAFSDTTVSEWYHDGVHFCLVQGLMVGTSDTTFAPGMDTSRAMVATILWRQAGSPAAKASFFDDVTADAWYAQAVAWAAENGVVEGYGNGNFGPDNAITREQLAAMLYRYAKTLGKGDHQRHGDPPLCRYRRCGRLGQGGHDMGGVRRSPSGQRHRHPRPHRHSHPCRDRDHAPAVSFQHREMTRP